MKNIRVIDGAENCAHDIFAATEAEFTLIFPPAEDVAFADEVFARGDHAATQQALASIWGRRLRKAEAMGIHGTLFYQLEHKKAYYPSRRDEEAANPDGSRLR